MGDDSEPDYRLRVEVWPADATKDPQVEHFAPNEWDRAIDRARAISREFRNIRDIRVVDAWRMEIARFTPRWFYDSRQKGAVSTTYCPR